MSIPGEGQLPHVVGLNCMQTLAHVLVWAMHTPVHVVLVLWGSEWSADVMTSTFSLDNLRLCDVCQGCVRCARLRRAACLL